MKPRQPVKQPEPTRRFQKQMEEKKKLQPPPVVETIPEYKLTPELHKKLAFALQHRLELTEALKQLYKTSAVVSVQLDKATDTVYYEVRGVWTDKQYWYGMPIRVVPTRVVGLEGVHNR